ncbi:MAG: hypothetical protein ACTSU9_18360 [Promethearchaeota archaeon]
MSLAIECAKSGCFDIAIADHVSEEGIFMYTSSGGGAGDLTTYINEIESLKAEIKDDLGVTLHAALEISSYTSDYKFHFRDTILPHMSHLDLILVDGWYLNDPVACARITRDVLDGDGRKGFPVFIAHPEYSSITGSNIHLISRKQIGLELNESKFSPTNRVDLERIVGLCESSGVPLPRLSLGSDAHSIADAGKVDIVLKFIKEHDLEKSLYFL